MERTGDGIGLKDGVGVGPVRFDGHKAAIVVDTDTQLITAVEVLPGNAPDNLGALELGGERGQYRRAGGPWATPLTATAIPGRHRLVAKVPGRPNRKHFPKEDFHIDLAAGTCTCPAGQVTRKLLPAGKRTGSTGRTHRLQAFRFDAAVCGACPLRSQCVAGSSGLGRTVQLHPQEALLQQARALQQSEAFAGYCQRRVVVEHRLARLVQLGIRQARYLGRTKTRFQLYLAATVANLTLLAGKTGLTGDIGGAAIGYRDAWAGVDSATATFGAIRLGLIWPLALLTPAFLPKALFSTKAFHPHF